MIRSTFLSSGKIGPRARRFSFLPLCMLFLGLHAALLTTRAAAATPNPVRITLGQAVVPLNSPWKFHTGDDPRWADPNFDDSNWETVDLTPPPGAHDFDVGLTGYVPGWQAKGHPRYSGYAWYRIRISVDAPPGETLALCGPFYVDNAYQVFVNGQLLGGSGDFSGRTPVVHNIHLPRLYPLPQLFASPGSAGSIVIAIRAWMGAWSLGPDTGGIHIAPALGTTSGAEALYHIQWSQMIKGYIVDASNAFIFLVLAVMACTLIPFDRSNSAYLWLVAALVLTALRWANQPAFFWWQFETIHEFELTTILLFVPLSVAAWTLAWCRWFRLPDWTWMRPVVGVLASVYVASVFSHRTWFYGVFPHWFGAATNFCITAVRFAFVLLTLFIIFRVVRQPGNERWFGLPAILAVSVGMYAHELTMLGIPGIWFPFGVGVSLSEYGLMVSHFALFVLLLHRLYSFRQQAATQTAVAFPSSKSFL